MNNANSKIVSYSEIEYAGILIYLVGFPDVFINETNKFACGYFSIRPRSSENITSVPAITIRYGVLKNAAFKYTFYDLDDESFNVTISAATNREEIWMASSDLSVGSSKTAARVIRALFLQIMLANGWNILHAAAIARGSSCIGLIGKKYGGKTTLLLNSMEHSDFLPVTNDKLAVQTNSEPIITYGVPMTAGIRKGTLDRFSELGSRFSNVHRESLADDKAIRLTVTELAEIYSRPIRTHGFLVAFVMPIINREVRQPVLRQLNQQDRCKVVGENVMSSLSTISPYQQKLESFFGRSIGSSTELLKIPVYSLEYSELCTRMAVNSLDKLLIDSPSPPVSLA